MHTDIIVMGDSLDLLEVLLANVRVKPHMRRLPNGKVVPVKGFLRQVDLKNPLTDISVDEARVLTTPGQVRKGLWERIKKFGDRYHIGHPPDEWEAVLGDAVKKADIGKGTRETTERVNRAMENFRANPKLRPFRDAFGDPLIIQAPRLFQWPDPSINQGVPEGMVPIASHANMGNYTVVYDPPQPGLREMMPGEIEDMPMPLKDQAGDWGGWSGVLRHEFGHEVSARQLPLDREGQMRDFLTGGWDLKWGRQADQYARSLKASGMFDAQGVPVDKENWTPEMQKDIISYYAFSSPEELWAECFAILTSEKYDRNQFGPNAQRLLDWVASYLNSKYGSNL